ncbi:MAG: gliding motility-associated C-terminal domain-containing protein [Bacteroidota bacterium]|nr:gliding motility-associated C-terminal domain-containing protein [Bacteroidota bacterium]
MTCKILRSVVLLLVCLALSVPYRASGTHLMGGELTYVHDGSTSGANFYNIKLIVYRYCDSTINPAPLDPSMYLGVYIDGSSGALDWYSTESLILINSTFVTSGNGNIGCTFSASACIERGEYEVSILLPDNSTGYHLMVERCCRNGNIMNLDNPGSAGMAFYGFIPSGVINSSPQITDISIPYLCTGDTVSVINNAFDPDGDSLSYSFVVPYNGYSGPPNPVPDPFLDNNPYFLPIPEIVYAPGYNLSNVFGAGGYAAIDPISGLTNYFIPNQGFYVAAIEIREYRNGVLLSTIRRDLQFITIPCTPNLVPNYTSPGATTVLTVDEGQTLCYDITFSDADGDSLFLVASGPLLDTAVVNPAGSIQDANGDSVVTSQFCWTPVCGTASTVPYQFFVTVTDNGCPAKISNEIFSVYVTTGPASQVATVAIQQPPGIICQGSDATFIANGTNQGTNPQFEWQVNGIPAGTNSPTFTAPGIVNGDIITVTMISNALCLNNDTAFSPPYAAVISSQPSAQVNITSNPSTTLCPQQICLFSANVLNGGAAPSYQWNLNGNLTGTNNFQFTAANPSGIMTVFVTVTPTTGCPPENSDTIFFNIVPLLVPAVNLSASVIDSVCPLQQVVFTANANNTGNPPVYSWFVNGILTGDTTSTITLPSINEGDEVYVTVTSDYECLTPDIGVSVPLDYHIFPQLTANLTDGPLILCEGESVALEMDAQGGKRNTYQYNWGAAGTSGAATEFTPDVTGFYVVSVDDACYDPVSDSIFIEVLPLPETQFTWEPYKPTIFLPHVKFTDQSVGAVSWYWSLDNTTLSDLQHPEHDYNKSGIYIVSLITTNQFGCTDTLVKLLEVDEYITAYMPNSFTPNGDGRNDEFGLVGESTGGYSMRIFNRWGGEVFRSDSGYERWNGKDAEGRLLPDGIYIYNFVITNDTSKKPYTGTVTLIR